MSGDEPEQIPFIARSCADARVTPSQKQVSTVTHSL